MHDIFQSWFPVFWLIIALVVDIAILAVVGFFWLTSGGHRFAWASPISFFAWVKIGSPLPRITGWMRNR